MTAPAPPACGTPDPRKLPMPPRLSPSTTPQGITPQGITPQGATPQGTATPLASSATAHGHLPIEGMPAEGLPAEGVPTVLPRAVASAHHAQDTIAHCVGTPRRRPDSRTNPTLPGWRNGTPRSIKLAGHCLVLQRDHRSIQFGLDATRDGILVCRDDERIHHIMRVLRNARTPVTMGALIRNLGEAGMSTHRARTVVADLLLAGILADERPIATEVLAIGHPKATNAIAGALTRLPGITVRNPDGACGPDPTSAVMEVRRDTPIVAVNFTYPSGALCKSFVVNPSTVIPVTLTARRLRIGPLHINGHGPCLVCEQLRRSSIDPQWMRIARQLHPHAAHPAATCDMDDHVLAAAADTISRHLEPLLRHMFTAAPNTAHVGPWPPGLVLDMDPTRWDYQRFVQAPDPRCPDCFDRGNG